MKWVHCTNIIMIWSFLEMLHNGNAKHDRRHVCVRQFLQVSSENEVPAQNWYSTTKRPLNEVSPPSDNVIQALLMAKPRGVHVAWPGAAPCSNLQIRNISLITINYVWNEPEIGNKTLWTLLHGCGCAAMTFKWKWYTPMIPPTTNIHQNLLFIVEMKMYVY